MDETAVAADANLANVSSAVLCTSINKGGDVRLECMSEEARKRSKRFNQPPRLPLECMQPVP